MDPVRFGFIEALAQRAAGQSGRVRQLLEARLAERVDAYAADLAALPAGGDRADGGPASALRPKSPLSLLLEHASQRSEAQPTGPVAAGIASAPPAIDRLDEVRRLSSRARTDSQLRQALEHAPENAGPLNSASLVHRALILMSEVSPEYLQPFMAYVDTLAWIEGMDIHGAQPAGSASPSAGGAKRPRAKARSRRS